MESVIFLIRIEQINLPKKMEILYYVLFKNPIMIWKKIQEYKRKAKQYAE